MKNIKEREVNLPITVSIIIFATFGMTVEFPQFTYAQTSDNNKTLDDALEQVGQSLEEIVDSLIFNMLAM